MIYGCEALVDVLQRAGPGVLSLSHLLAELNAAAPGERWSAAQVRLAVQGSESRIQILDVSLDPPEVHEASPLLDSWALVTQRDDAPAEDPLVRAIWDGLTALASHVDPASRVSVSRWILKAAEANAVCRLIRERGPPPTTPRLQPHPQASVLRSPGRVVRPRAAPRECLP